jgi:uncharacterized membrane protein
MARVREEVEIEAPAERVWSVVHEDLKNAPKWSTNLVKAESLDENPPVRGSRIRYYVKLPGGTRELEVKQTVYSKPKRCAGVFTDGPLEGRWSYSYREAEGVTKLTYEMEFELGGLLRLAGGMLARQYAEGIKKNMKALKRYVEEGKGPRARPQKAAS